MKPTSVSQTLEQFLNCVLSITFVYACIGKEAYIMAAAGNLSTTLSIVVSFTYLVIYYRGNKIEPEPGQKSPERRKSDKELLKTILAISIPITFGSIISVISSVIDTATVSNCIQYAYRNAGMTKEALESLAMSNAGILSKVDTLVTFPLAINIALSTALVPSISESIAKKEFKTASKRMSFSLLASILIIVPCAIGFISLANPILKMIYPTASDGALILQISSISMIFIALNHTMNGGLYGLNLPRVPAVALALGIIVKTILNVILVSNPKINIAGAAIGTLVCQIITFSLCLKVLKMKLKTRLNLKKEIIKPFVSAITMGVVVYIVQGMLCNVIGNTVSTLISIVIGVMVYGLMILFTKVLSEDDILMIPFGAKVYPILVKLKIYK